MTWDGCMTCGQPTKHADWCGWVNKAIKEAREDGAKVKPWWPWWLEPFGQPHRFTSETARAARMKALGRA